MFTDSIPLNPQHHPAGATRSSVSGAPRVVQRVGRTDTIGSAAHKDASPTEAGGSSRVRLWRLVIARALCGKKEGGLGLVSTTPSAIVCSVLVSPTYHSCRITITQICRLGGTGPCLPGAGRKRAKSAGRARVSPMPGGERVVIYVFTSGLRAVARQRVDFSIDHISKLISSRATVLAISLSLVFISRLIPRQKRHKQQDKDPELPQSYHI